MQSFDDRTTSAIHPNAFTKPFLSRLAERDEPPTAGDADVAGPWRIEPIPGHGFGLFRIGESCRVSRSSAVEFSEFFVASRSGKGAVPDSAGGGGIRDCFGAGR